MSNNEGEARDRAAEEAALGNEQAATRTGSGSGDHLESLDRSDANVLSPAGLGPDNPHAANPDLGQANMQERMDKINEVGYIGGTADPTPNENYSLQTPPDAPTPETDPELAAKLAANVAGDRFANVNLSTAQTAAGAAEPEKAPGTKTPAESQAELSTTTGGTASDTETSDEDSVQALVSQGYSEEDARAQVATWKEGRQ